MALAGSLAACGGDDDDNDVPVQDGGTLQDVAEVGCAAFQARRPGETFINAIITSDTTWDCTNQYRIFDTLIVDSGDPENPATLTITEGTIIEASVSGEFPALLVTPNGRLVVEGTAAEPVVFRAAAANARRGEWGGIFLSGRARLNTETGFGTLLPWAEFEDRAIYGGGLEAPDQEGTCGTLNYVRLEFAGQVPVGSAQNYTPALTLAGCGSGTVVDHLQVHRPLNRGIEIRGGAPVLRHVIVDQPSRNDDQPVTVPTDGIAWMEGWVGEGQYIVVQVNDGGIGFVGMNNLAMPEAEPVSAPTFYNVSIFGLGFRSRAVENGGILLTSGSAGSFHNVVMAGARSYAIDVFGDASGAALSNGAGFHHATLWDIGPSLSRDEPGAIFFPTPDPTPEDGVNEESILRDASRANVFGEIDPDFEGNPYSIENPNFNVIASAASTDAAEPAEGFDPAGNFRGGVDPRQPDWTRGWTNFAPQ